MHILTGKFIKKHILFFILIPLVFISQIYLLKPNLSMGLDLTFDEYITGFRQIENSTQNPVEFVIKTVDKLRLAWWHEYYYVGILNHILGDNWVAYHQVAHFFKSLAAISTYALFYVLAGSSPIAFVSSLIFAFSYSSAGSLEPLVVNGDYIGIINISIFLTIYYYLVKKKSGSGIFIYLTGSFFLLLSLAIATTRAFPLVLIILLTESFMFLRDRSAGSIKLILKRLAAFLLPVILAVMFVLLYKPSAIAERVDSPFAGIQEFIFSSPDKVTWNSNYRGGEYELLLIPFLSFASTILPVRLWPSSTTALFIVLTPILGFLLSKKPKRFILLTFSFWALGFLTVNWLWSISSSHQFIDLKDKSIIGFYILGLGFSFFIEYLNTKNKLYIGLFLGPLFSFLFILLTWLFTQERLLVFVNIHRYLTLSTIFISFFIGSLILLLYRRLKDSKQLRSIAFLPLLLIPIFFFISSNEIDKYYAAEFSSGFALKDMDYMRRQLVPYLNDPFYHLIYIDISSDKKNSYFYEQIYQYGPLYWMSWYDKSLYSIDFEGSHEKVPHSIFDYNLLKSSVRTKDGITGIAYPSWSDNPIFYATNKFSAVRVIDKKVIDIKEEVIEELGLTP